MKGGRTSAATLGLVGGVVLGAWIGSEMTLMNSRDVAAPEPAVAAAAAPVQEPIAPAMPARTRRVTRVTRPAPATANVTPAPRKSTPKLVMTIPVSAPELHQRMKQVLARGTKLPLAVEGFTSAEQFATLAHAARNTQVPFVLLKYRVLTEGQSLEHAIRVSRPEIDAKTEALKARGEARADILSLSSNGSATSSN